MDDDFEEDDLFFCEENSNTVAGFNKMTLAGRFFDIWWHGKYIGTVVQKEYYLLYYSLPDFFVRIYHHLEEDKVTDCIAFDDPSELDPLLDELNVDPFAFRR